MSKCKSRLIATIYTMTCFPHFLPKKKQVARMSETEYGESWYELSRIPRGFVRATCYLHTVPLDHDRLPIGGFLR